MESTTSNSTSVKPRDRSGFEARQDMRRLQVRRATTQMFGLSLTAVFMGLLLLNAVSF